MTNDLDALEARAYRRSYSDGIIDLFVGLSLLWIGAAWLWLEDYAGLAGVLPAVLVTVVLGYRKQFIERRMGYVKWSEPRRRWERRNLVLMFLGGVATFAAGVVAFFGYEAGGAGRDLLDQIGPGLVAFLLGLMIGGLALVMNTPRMLGYAAVLFAGGVAAASVETNPGWPLLAAGIVITAVGAAMLARFTSSHPSAESE